MRLRRNSLYATRAINMSNGGDFFLFACPETPNSKHERAMFHTGWHFEPLQSMLLQDSGCKRSEDLSVLYLSI